MVYKPKKNYTWGKGWKPSIDANVVGGVIEHIQAEKGSVNKENFLDFSRPVDSPTHDIFEWDDSKAAEKYRLEQSCNTIGNLRTVQVTPSHEEVYVKAFQNISALGEKPCYQSIDIALKDENARANILNRIRGELDNFVQRNRHIEELADMLIETGEKLKN
jgi:hypothetical protein